MSGREELQAMVRGMREGAQGAFGEGVEAMISEIRRFAAAAEQAIGEISIDEAFEGVARTVNDRVAQLTGKPPASASPSPGWRPIADAPCCEGKPDDYQCPCHCHGTQEQA